MYQYFLESVVYSLGVKSIKAIILLFALFIVLKLEEIFLDKLLSKSQRIALVIKPVRYLVKYTTWGLGIIVFFTSVLELDYKSILSTISLSGLAVSIVAQSIIRDMIVGFLIYVEGQYRIGDFITIHSKKSLTGEVISMGARTTRLRDIDGAIHVLNNSEITVFTNYSASHKSNDK